MMRWRIRLARCGAAHDTATADRSVHVLEAVDGHQRSRENPPVAHRCVGTGGWRSAALGCSPVGGVVHGRQCRHRCRHRHLHVKRAGLACPDAAHQHPRERQRRQQRGVQRQPQHPHRKHRPVRLQGQHRRAVRQVGAGPWHPCHPGQAPRRGSGHGRRGPHRHAHADRGRQRHTATAAAAGDHPQRRRAISGAGHLRAGGRRHRSGDGDRPGSVDRRAVQHPAQRDPPGLPRGHRVQRRRRRSACHGLVLEAGADRP